jgi:hypothetical protein
MRRAAKIDDTQPPIVRTLRQIGASVQSIAAVGEGCPDLLVGYHGMNLLMECKSADGDFTPKQVIWHNEWRGRKVATVRSVGDAIAALNRAVREP